MGSEAGFRNEAEGPLLDVMIGDGTALDISLEREQEVLESEDKDCEEGEAGGGLVGGGRRGDPVRRAGGKRRGPSVLTLGRETDNVAIG